MKLFELTGVKKYADETLANIIKMMQDKMDVATGSFGIAIIPENKDYIYKIWTKDAGFEKFVKYVQAHSGSKHLPKFLGNVRQVPMFFKHPDHIDEGQKLNVLRIEKLEELTPDQKEQTWAIVSLLDRIKLKSLVREDMDLIVERATRLARVDCTDLEDFAWCAVEVMAAIDDPKMVQDLKGNIMRRGTTPVIMDPYFKNNTWGATASDLVRAKESERNIFRKGSTSK